jgi:GNAT superfamily N-acetyltransferase
MTFPAYRALLNFSREQPLPVIVGARADGAPIGLALALIDTRRTYSELLSIYVDGNYRNRGVASVLVERTCAELTVRGFKSVHGCYMTGQPVTAALERVLAKTGWSAPLTRMLVVRCTLDSVAGAPWIENFRTLPTGYSLIPWVNLTAHERACLRSSNERDHWIADDLIPFDFEFNIEPVTSLALRYRGVIVGWCLNHIVGDVLRFTCSYMRTDLARLGRILLLYSEAVTRMTHIGITEGMWAIPACHSQYVRFAKRWMQPYSVFFGETRGIHKSLAPQTRMGEPSSTT